MTHVLPPMTWGLSFNELREENEKPQTAFAGFIN
jgi:hypothetical protein